jgi:hypothetical protein
VPGNPAGGLSSFPEQRSSQGPLEAALTDRGAVAGAIVLADATATRCLTSRFGTRARAPSRSSAMRASRPHQRRFSSPSRTSTPSPITFTSSGTTAARARRGFRSNATPRPPSGPRSPRSLPRPTVASRTTTAMSSRARGMATGCGWVPP